MDYKAVLLDFDGTVTTKGTKSPSKKMAEVLCETAMKIPLGFCTGREFGSLEKHMLGVLLEEIEESKRIEFLKNLYLFAENGAIGYHFNEAKGGYEEFFRVKWPEEFIARVSLEKKIEERLGEIGDIGEVLHKHSIVSVIQARVDGDHYNKENVGEIYKNSDRIYEVCVDLLKEIDPDYENYLHVGNSGIGVLIGPADGDKDKAVVRFAEYLGEKRGFSFGEDVREVLCIGDRPLKGGNDYYFLRGEFGTTYTVGDYNPDSEFPLPVEVNNSRLFHDEGTAFLLTNLHKIR